MTHVAIQEKKDGKVVDRMEKVSDEQYQVRLRAEEGGCRLRCWAIGDKPISSLDHVVTKARRTWPFAGDALVCVFAFLARLGQELGLRY
jgi:hypothetical protein